MVMRVLIAVEDELFARAIVDFVSAHGWRPDTQMKVLYVVERPFAGDEITAIYGAELQAEMLKYGREFGDRLVQQVQQWLQDRIDKAIPLETSVIVGKPHHAIVYTAQEWPADMIVMGSHGRHGLSKFLLGSVSMAVLSQAPCTAVIVRLAQGSKEKAA
jgi:nucleotide-binding universal stress UspA family protein